MDFIKLTDYFFLFLLCTVETVGYFFLLCKLERRMSKKWQSLLSLSGLIIVMVILILAAQTGQLTRDIYSNTYTAFYYLSIFLFIFLYYRISFKESLYYIIVIFLSTRFIKHAIGHLIILYSGAYHNYLVEGYNWGLRFLSCLTLLGTYLLVFYIIRRYLMKNSKEYLTYGQLLWMFLSVAPVIYIGNKAYSTMEAGSWAKGNDAILFEMITSICGLLIVIGNEYMLALQKNKNDLLQMEYMLKKQHEQYQLKKETVEMVNRKYHDLKNHLSIIDKITNADERHNYVTNLQDQLLANQILQQTGNDILDIILSDKHLQCEQKEIQLILFVQGELLYFLKPVDIATIFGNALDNAIEGTEKLTKTGKREIIVRVTVKGNWLLIRFENNCLPDYCWKGEELMTTKHQSQEHGYGIKNIRYVIDQYEGTMTINAEQNHFYLNIMIPMPGESQERQTSVLD